MIAVSLLASTSCQEIGGLVVRSATDFSVGWFVEEAGR